MDTTLRYADAGVIVDNFASNTTQCAFTTISAGALRGRGGSEPHAHPHLCRRRDLRLPGAKARCRECVNGCKNGRDGCDGKLTLMGGRSPSSLPADLSQLCTPTFLETRSKALTLTPTHNLTLTHTKTQPDFHQIANPNVCAATWM